MAWVVPLLVSSLMLGFSPRSMSSRAPALAAACRHDPEYRKWRHKGRYSQTSLFHAPRCVPATEFLAPWVRHSCFQKARDAQPVRLPKLSWQRRKALLTTKANMMRLSKRALGKTTSRQMLRSTCQQCSCCMLGACRASMLAVEAMPLPPWCPVRWGWKCWGATGVVI